MFPLFTILLTVLTSGPAQAASVEESATLLSRFPIGLMPASVSVLDAVGTIGEQGEESHLTLLESWIAEEDRTIREASLQAVRAITGRKQLSIRHRFKPPTAQDLNRWITNHKDGLKDPKGHPYGKTESFSMAYADFVVGDSKPTRGIENWRAIGRQLEIQGEVSSALHLYATVASTGNIEAGHEIEEFGLNPELLVLGMYSTQRVDTPNNTLDVLIRSGSLLTVRFLTERSCNPDPMGRAIALDALSQMIARGTLTTGAAYVAHRSLVSATSDPSTNVRTLAQAALSELSSN